MDAQTGAAFPLAYHLMGLTQAGELRSNTPIEEDCQQLHRVPGISKSRNLKLLLSARIGHSLMAQTEIPWL